VLVAWLQLAPLGNVLNRRHPRKSDSGRCRIAAILAAHPFPVREVLAEAEQKQRLEIDFRENWTPQRSSRWFTEPPEFVAGSHVSNREPYIPNFDADQRR